MSLWKRIHGMLPVLPWWAEEEGLIPAAEFRRLLELERSRAERTTQGFTLLTFLIPPGEDGRRLVPRLAGALFKRVRSTDTAGWLDETRVGVILPETSPEGAHRLGNETAGRLAALGWPVHYKICVFSSHCSPWARDGRSERSDGSGGSDGSVGSRPQFQSHDCAEDDEPMEPLFAVRVPLWKRGLDLLGAAAGLAVLWPLMLLVAAAVRLVSPGPALFRQERVTVAGRVFTFLKFRSMHAANDPSGHRNYVAELIHSDRPMRKIEDDPRIFPLGRLLRKTCLDELPQLINVLRGEMSLVGPRPCLPYEAAEYSRWHARRFDLPPGMTGLWQVSGKNECTFREMILLDIAYARRLSPWLDLKILARTPLAVLGHLRAGRSKVKEVLNEQSA